ncbi:hypothetical protein ABTX81_04250 [Kitasatospora sp. NPDC097605]|uniref:hypothetical protein n=1 Tax=Kitasatospora sp. NPDC097605 TaxID=3157226 RepID=UPI0033200B1A
MTGATIAITLVLIITLGITTGTVAFFRLQRHRADAVAMAEYRRLAEEAVAGQEVLHGRLSELHDRLEAVETLLRSVE